MDRKQLWSTSSPITSGSATECMASASMTLRLHHRILPSQLRNTRNKLRARRAGPDQPSAEPRSLSLLTQESRIRRDDFANALLSTATINQPIPGKISIATPDLQTLTHLLQ